jgi:hypothetical protein
VRAAIRLMTMTALFALAGACDPEIVPIDPDTLPCVPGRAPGTDGQKPFCHTLDLAVLTHEAGAPLFTDESVSAAEKVVSPGIRVVAPADDVIIVGGLQGLHMVVLGFRTAAVMAGNLRVEASITGALGELARRQWSKRGVTDGSDGYGYGLDLFLVVDDGDWRAWVDEPATLTLTVNTTDGLLIGRSAVDVVLRSDN